MVKIIDKSLENLARKKETNKLFQILNRKFPDENIVVGSIGAVYLKAGEIKQIVASCKPDLFCVYNPAYLEKLVKVAEEYEKLTKREVVIHKEYE